MRQNSLSNKVQKDDLTWRVDFLYWFKAGCFCLSIPSRAFSTGEIWFFSVPLPWRWNSLADWWLETAMIGGWTHDTQSRNQCRRRETQSVGMKSWRTWQQKHNRLFEGNCETETRHRNSNNKTSKRKRCAAISFFLSSCWINERNPKSGKDLLPFLLNLLSFHLRLSLSRFCSSSSSISITCRLHLLNTAAIESGFGSLSSVGIKVTFFDSSKTCSATTTTTTDKLLLVVLLQSHALSSWIEKLSHNNKKYVFSFHTSRWICILCARRWEAKREREILSPCISFISFCLNTRLNFISPFVFHWMLVQDVLSTKHTSQQTSFHLPSDWGHWSTF